MLLNILIIQVPPISLSSDLMIL